MTTRDVPILVAAAKAESVCPFRKGDGRCAKCAGSGLRHAVRGWLRRRVEVECVACDGTGVCALCRGDGMLRWTNR